jgi:ankyrin repeat protein
MKKANVNIRDQERKTPLKLALAKGDNRIIQLLKRYDGKV